MFEILLKKIETILKANTLIAVVYAYEAEELQGDPAAIVIPSENESDYITNQENIRIYAFTIRVFVKRTKPRTPVKSDEILRDLVSTVIDDFDKDYLFTGLDTLTGYTFINVFAAPSSWGYAGREDQYRVAEINLRCRVSVDVGAIS